MGRFSFAALCLCLTFTLPKQPTVVAFVEEIADGQPAAANLKTVDEHCPISDTGQALCTQAEIRDLTTPETQLLSSDTYLGCRNPVGLDHILVGPGIDSTGPAEHLSIGSYGGDRAGTPNGKSLCSPAVTTPSLVE